MHCVRILPVGRHCVAPRVAAYAITWGSAYSSLISDYGGALQASRRCASASAHGAWSSAAARTPKLNYYRSLGVDTDATPQEVKTAYRQLALRYHPDVAEEAQRAQAEMLFRRISEAYEVLSDPVRRRAHDAELGIKTRRTQQPSTTAEAAGTPPAANAKAGARAGSPAGGAPSSSTPERRRAQRTSTASASSPSTAHQQRQHRRYRKPFVRGDANRVFADAFDGKTLDEILFDVQRRRRQEKCGGVAAAQRHEMDSSSEQAARNETAKSSSPLLDAEENVALDRDARLRHVVEAAAESFAQRAQRQYGHGILRHIRAAARLLPEGPAAPPESYMPFRPFVGMPAPPGVQIPPEPHMGRVLSPQEATVDNSSASASPSAALGEIPKHFHTHTYADGTPQSRAASLAKATRYINGMPHNMGQLYSYHRPY
ncbi:hypothetical protein LSCM1_03726 [Leishmania martiniquensis]|uniref:J domain-containing protein n=1 Tax=Leishmania martiniquensis TaxID=1580590 RepID=A0A836KGW8_9TRYP|nr:hypothetical protein LSCM1_03726 [Leishmania martiniquensis]